MHDAMLDRLGPQGWWPARTRLEVIVGAILVQSTAWGNVEKAIRRLRSARALSARALRDIPEPALARLIRPAGTFRVKARRIKRLVAWLDAGFGMDLDGLFARPAGELRDALLSVEGIGPETADAILLYAGGKPSLVVGAYARRILERHGLAPAGASYGELKRLLEPRLPADAALLNEHHALMVRVGKDWCRKGEPLCGNGCPLEPFLNRRAAPPGGASRSPRGTPSRSTRASSPRSARDDRG